MAALLARADEELRSAGGLVNEITAAAIEELRARAHAHGSLARRARPRTFAPRTLRNAGAGRATAVARHRHLVGCTIASPTVRMLPIG